MQKKPIRIGLVGGGFMAKAHSNAYHTIPYIYNAEAYTPELVMVGAITAEEAAVTADRYGFSRSCAGYRELVESGDIDVVDICVSDALHKEIALEALKHGKHVLCEKPMALNSEDARQMRDAAKQAGLKAMCGFNYRFVSAVMLARNLIQSGKMGRVYHFSGCYQQDVGYAEDTPLEKLWYAQGSKGSGVALGIGSHLIDMARFLVGEITEVSGIMPIYTPKRSSQKGQVPVEKEEDMLATASFDSGATGLLRASAVSAGRKNRLAWEISCSKGTLVFDLENLNYLDVFYGESPLDEVSGFNRVNVTQADRNHPFMDVWWPRGHVLGWEHAHINEIAHFLHCIARDKPLEPEGATFEDGYKTALIIDGIRQAAEQKKTVKIGV
ncbi:MAG: Gfo/Idh/MocA family oxidoreductase [Treponema sp.]|jgi:predicted dehydrogenase|nr:Gfo/Idh/MocA family oxidoreductase [Treponema sp.]